MNVICLVGERGREVREFIERDLGDAITRSVVVVATGDQPALVRIKAALTATAIAEFFRDEGRDVMLMMDSVTRFAMAQREVGLAIGEPPATRGYTPSVFAMLPRLLERSGTSDVGSITGLYTTLVDGDDMNEPIADAVRSILDGHVVLTRQLAHQGHYPAIDVLQSVSRLVGEITPDHVQEAGQEVRELLAAYREQKDLIAIGAYEHGSSPVVDRAIALKDDIDRFLRQRAPSRAPSRRPTRRSSTSSAAPARRTWGRGSTSIRPPTAIRRLATHGRALNRRRAILRFRVLTLPGVCADGQAIPVPPAAVLDLRERAQQKAEEQLAEDDGGAGAGAPRAADSRGARAGGRREGAPERRGAAHRPGTRAAAALARTTRALPHRRRAAAGGREHEVTLSRGALVEAHQKRRRSTS